MTPITETPKTEEKIAGAEALPMRGELADSSLPHKHISETFGGKAMHVINHYLIGGVVNFTISMVITYFANPRPETKAIKEGITRGISKLFGGLGPKVQEKIHNGARSGMEVIYMYAAGLITTGIMTPLVINQQKLAYKLNKYFSPKDAAILPDELRVQQAPKTVEEKIEQELARRVHYKHSGGDLWKARLLTMGVVWVGDQGNEAITRPLEEKKLYSLDTIWWRAGLIFSKMIPEKFAGRLNGFLSSHGAGLDAIGKNASAHLKRIEGAASDFAVNNGPVSDGKKAISESIRIAGKEATYMVPLTIMVSKFTSFFHRRRVARQQEKALAELKQEGIVPEGYDVKVSEQGRVELAPDKNWSASVASKPRSEKTESFTAGVETGRAAGQQLAIP